jgi:phosphotriesterase-related protein
MMAIQTVLGPVSHLGFCHSHEHLFIARGTPALVNPVLVIDDYELTKQEALMFKEAGGEAIVDAQPLGCGRMEQEQIRLAQETGLKLVLPTGFHKLSFYRPDHWIRTYDARRLADIFIHELQTGMFVGTDEQEPGEYIEARAGFIKVAIDQERLEDRDWRWFEASAEASLTTGAPIMCHVESSEQAWELVRYYKSRGVPAERIIICHLDRSLDEPDQHLLIAEEGVYLEYDTIGRFKYHDDEGEADLIVRMVNAGFSNRLLLGLDTTRARLLAYQGEIGLTYLIRSFLPLLRQRGLSQADIDRFMIHNPTRAFSISG